MIQTGSKKHKLLNSSTIKKWLDEMRNTFDTLSSDEQQALKADPIRLCLCPNDAATLD